MMIGMRRELLNGMQALIFYENRMTDSLRTLGFEKQKRKSGRTMEINKNTPIARLIRIDQEIQYILMNNGMHCVGCAASSNETLEQACAVHGLNCDDVVDEINDYLSWAGM